LAGDDCDPGKTYYTNKGNHNCGETTCFYRAGLCDCNGNGKADPGEPKFTCVSNNKYYEGHKGGEPQFKKPPVVCNDLCGNFNCTYTFYTKENCETELANETDHPVEKNWKTATIYPIDCANKTNNYDPGCQYKRAPASWNTDMEGKYVATTNLIVRGWGTYFELDHSYKSVKFNGYGNCGFFLYGKKWFGPPVGKFRGYVNPNKPLPPWNAKSDFAGSLCRNINLDFFGGAVGSLETNDTCWGNAGRTGQTQSPAEAAAAR